ncbi:hypothetical protein JM78_26795 [Burkholderia pyrrocinia]|nr:hypothetical protein JM78_26795 [Burkholderia pyrrocinia]
MLAGMNDKGATPAWRGFRQTTRRHRDDGAAFAFRWFGDGKIFPALHAPVLTLPELSGLVSMQPVVPRFPAMND